ncbi:MAG: NAD(P)-dependent oxidoreductase [Acidobacteriota bacterium]
MTTPSSSDLSIPRREPDRRLPRIMITGASGFLGRHLLDALKEKYRIVGMARRSQRESGAPVHHNISWSQVDIGDAESLATVFKKTLEDGPIEVLIHLAAFYDFTGDPHPEYYRTNVDGLRNVLELAKDMHLKRFIFASSVAACYFPAPGTALDEFSPPDGEHIYAVTKRIGEEMVATYRDKMPYCIVRFGAMFSDWCEYPPLYVFLETWLSRVWNRRVLAGKGRSAIPYLHVRDAVVFMTKLLERHEYLPPDVTLVASTDGAVSHLDLFESATTAYLGRRVRPTFMPKLICRIGLYAMDWMGRVLGSRPFERPWMGQYIDLEMTVKAKVTREMLDWSPKARLQILRRIPFLMENLKTNPIEWGSRNRAAMKGYRMHANLRIHRLLEIHEEQIRDMLTQTFLGPEAKGRFGTYQRINPEDLDWNHRLILRHLKNAVRTREKALFMAYCRDLAGRRFEQGFSEQEVCDAVTAVGEVSIRVLRADPQSEGLENRLHDYITMTIHLGLDEIQEVFEELSERHRPTEVLLRP